MYIHDFCLIKQKKYSKCPIFSRQQKNDKLYKPFPCILQEIRELTACKKNGNYLLDIPICPQRNSKQHRNDRSLGSLKGNAKKH